MAQIRNKDLTFEELPVKEFPTIRELRRELNEHLKEAPCFMQADANDFERWITNVEKGDRRTFVALKSAGFEYLGVDYESYNPTANRFWAKHFMEYTNSVTRRIELWCKEYNA